MRLKIRKLISVSLVLLLWTLSLSAEAVQKSAKQSPTKVNPPLFTFHADEFWLNLHHFLYVLGRAENKERDSSREAVSGAPPDQDRGLATLSPNDQKLWRETVSAYAVGPSKKDIVFDESLSAITKDLTAVGNAKSLAGAKIDPVVAAILERAAPIYKKAWWSNHHQANVDWQKSIQALVDRYGASVLAFITNAYKIEWPATGFPVHLSAYANWAGAYSVIGNLLVLSSLNSDTHGNYGLETVFHEGMHQWDEQIQEAMRAQAQKLNKIVPRGLSHALIFFTAGEAVKHVLPDHVPYAIQAGVWQRGIGPFKSAVEEIWKPYLDGRGTRDEALAELIKRLGVDPPAKPTP